MRVLTVEDERGVAQILTNTREVYMKQLLFVSALVLAFSVASVAQPPVRRRRYQRQRQPRRRQSLGRRRSLSRRTNHRQGSNHPLYMACGARVALQGVTRAGSLPREADHVNALTRSREPRRQPMTSIRSPVHRDAPTGHPKPEETSVGGTGAAQLSLALRWLVL